MATVFLTSGNRLSPGSSKVGFKLARVSHDCCVGLGLSLLASAILWQSSQDAKNKSCFLVLLVKIAVA